MDLVGGRGTLITKNIFTHICIKVGWPMSLYNYDEKKNYTCVWPDRLDWFELLNVTTANRADARFVVRTRGDDVRKLWSCSRRDGLIVRTRTGTAAATSLRCTLGCEKHLCALRNTDCELCIRTRERTRVLGRACVIMTKYRVSKTERNKKTVTHVGLRRGAVKAKNGKREKRTRRKMACTNPGFDTTYRSRYSSRYWSRFSTNRPRCLCRRWERS